MNRMFPVLLTGVLLGTTACMRESPSGGNLGEGPRNEEKSFRILVPNSTTAVQQGRSETVVLTIDRDKYFAQDIHVRLYAPDDIELNPVETDVLASDKADFQVLVTAPADAAIATHHVRVEAHPQSGRTVLNQFDVQVTAPR